MIAIEVPQDGLLARFDPTLGSHNYVTIWISAGQGRRLQTEDVPSLKPEEALIRV